MAKKMCVKPKKSKLKQKRTIAKLAKGKRLNLKSRLKKRLKQDVSRYYSLLRKARTEIMALQIELEEALRKKKK